MCRKRLRGLAVGKPSHWGVLYGPFRLCDGNAVYNVDSLRTGVRHEEGVVVPTTQDRPRARFVKMRLSKRALEGKHQRARLRRVAAADAQDRSSAPGDHLTAVTARQDPIRVGTARGLHARRRPSERRGPRDARQLVLRIGRSWTGSGLNAAAATVRSSDHGKAVVMRIVRSLGALAVLAAVWLAIGVSSASASAVVNTIPVGSNPVWGVVGWHPRLGHEQRRRYGQ